MNQLSGKALFAGILCILAVNVSARTISFSGLDWTVRNSVYGSPGKNYWRSDNVWLDELGRLHLAIRKVDGRWTCAELQTTRKFLYGKFTFKIVGRVDQFDQNVVLGLFSYPPEPSKRGLGEIDIEFARWGNAANNVGNFSVWSDLIESDYSTLIFPVSLFGTYTRHVFTRKPKSVAFQSFHGHTGKNEIFSWNHSGNDLSKMPMPIYLNFWLFRGQPPANGREAEIIISEVSFSP